MRKDITSKALLGPLTYLSLSCLSTGLSGATLLAMATEISGSFAADAIKGLTKQKLKALIWGSHPKDYNLSIRKLFIQSLSEALDNVYALYKESGANTVERKHAHKLIGALQKLLADGERSVLSDSFWSDKDVLRFIREEAAPEDITHVLQEAFCDNPSDQKFLDFISRHYPAQIQLCFGEGLQAPEHHSAWVAYQRLMSDELRLMLSELSAEQQTLKKELRVGDLGHGWSEQQWLELRKLSELLEQPQKFELALNEALAKTLGSIELQVNQLIHLTTATHHTVKEIKQIQREQLRHGRRIHRSVLGLLLLFLLSGATITWLTLRAPFNYVLQLHGWRGQTHIPLRSHGTLVLRVDGKSYRADINSRGQALFIDLPAGTKNKQAKVYLEDTDGMPYYCLDNLVQITQGELAYLAISLEGIDCASGIVKDEVSQEPLVGAHVRVATVEGYTDSNGEFSLLIPQSEQAEELEFQITHAGYYPYRANHIMIGKAPSRIYLAPK